MILNQLITTFMEEAQVKDMDSHLAVSETIIVNKNLLAAYRTGKLTPSAAMLQDIITYLSKIAWITEENYDQLYNEKTYQIWRDSLDFNTEDYSYQGWSKILDDESQTSKKLIATFKETFANKDDELISASISDKNYNCIIDAETLKDKDTAWVELELRHYFFNKGYFVQDQAPVEKHDEYGVPGTKTFERRYYNDKPVVDTGLKDWWYTHFLSQLEALLEATIETYTPEEEKTVRTLLDANRYHYPLENIGYTIEEQLSKRALDIDKLIDLGILNLRYKGKAINKRLLLDTLDRVYNQQERNRELRRQKRAGGKA